MSLEIVLFELGCMMGNMGMLLLLLFWQLLVMMWTLTIAIIGGLFSESRRENIEDIRIVLDIVVIMNIT